MGNGDIMKKLLAIPLICVVLLCGCITGDDSTELTIYTYDSFVSDWGPGPLVIPMFEEKHGVKVTIVSMGSSGDMISRAILEKDDPKADILLGINDLQMYRVLEHNILESYKPKEYDTIPAYLIMDEEWRVTPYDYGFMSIIYDSEVVDEPPRSFEDLKDEKWKGKLIVEDPRTSSPGLSFLLWTVAAYGDEFPAYWESIEESLLTVAPSWSTAYYGMFLGGEAPLVVSYSTSPAYHLEFEDTNRYKGVIFEEGGFLQIEGAGIVNGAAHSDLARKFIDFMLSEEFQRELPLTQFMMPVNQDVQLPDSFSIVETTDNILPLDRTQLETSLDEWIRLWLSAIGG